MRALVGASQVVLAVLVCVAGCGKAVRERLASRSAAGPSLGQMAPDIEGEDIDGAPLKLSDFRGKVVVLNFWGDW